MAHRKICAWALGLLMAAPGAARAEGPMTIADAVHLALAHNERALQAPLRAEAAEGGVEKSRAAFLPTLNAQGTASLASPLPPKSNNPVAGQLSLLVPLVNLSAIPLYRQAKHQRESERWGAVQDGRQVGFDAAKAFLAVIASEHVAAAATRRLEHAKANQDDITARAAAQLTGSNDVTRASLESATAAATVNQAEGNVTIAYLELGFVVGQDVKGPLTEPESTTHAAQHRVWKMDEVIRNAEARRPDIQSAAEKTGALRAFAEEPLYRMAPTLNATGQLKQQFDPVAPDNGRSESVLLTLNWALYDGGARYGDRRTRVAQAESQVLEEKLLRRGVATDVNVALSSLRTARAAFAIAEGAVEIAAHNTEETGVLYKQGLARAIEVTDANQTRFDAEVSRANAKLAMEQAYLQLRFVLGLDPIGAEARGANAPAGNLPPTPPAAGSEPKAAAPSAPGSSGAQGAP